MILPVLTGCASDEPAGDLSVTPTSIALRQGTAASLRLAWTPTRPLDKVEGEPTVFVHLVHPRDGTVRTFDHPFPRKWAVGTRVEYEFDLALSALGDPLEPGGYELGIGLYDPQLGYRWPLATNGEAGDRREYRVAQVTIEPGDGPRFGFSQGWDPVVPGTTKQIVARRWLQGPGSIELSGVHGAGAVLLDVYLGAVPAGAEGAPALSARLEAACGGQSEEPVEPVNGPGPSHLAVPLAIEDGATCLIRLLPAGDGPGAWLQLEGLAWRPGSRAPSPDVNEGGTTG